MKPKIKVNLKPYPEPKPFRCTICGEEREAWQKYIEGKRFKVCTPCSVALTPIGARLGWRHYEHFSYADASTWGDINHLVIMLGAVG